MKPDRSPKTLLAAVGLSLLALLGCAGIALFSIVAHPLGNPIIPLFPTALSLFPVVGLVAAFMSTQLLKRRRVLQLKAIRVERS